MTDHYSVLEISRDATRQDVEGAFRRLSRSRHPDRGGSTAQFQELEAAYSTLRDASRRKAYDDELAGSFGTGTPADVGGDAAAAPSTPPEPAWGTESPVVDETPATGPARPGSGSAPSWGDDGGTVPLTWTPPPLPEHGTLARRRRWLLGVASGAVAAVLVLASVALVSGGPAAPWVVVATAVFVATCARRAFGRRAGAWSIIALVFVAPWFLSTTTAAAPAAVGVKFGWAALVVVALTIVMAELWRRDRAAREAAAFLARRTREHAERVRDLAVFWHRMLVQAREPGVQLRWVVHASVSAGRTYALLEDTRTYARAKRWLWGAWRSGIWVLVNTRTDEVVYWATDEARLAWVQVGPTSRAG